MQPEELARVEIDKMLVAAGWEIQPFKKLNLGAGIGVAVTYFPMKDGKEADYLLFVDRKAVGVLEAKAVGSTLGGVDFQSEGYAERLPDFVQAPVKPLPFLYESTGVETYYRDLRDIDSRSRRVFHFHRPEGLRELLRQSDTLRTRLRAMPPLAAGNLWSAQIEAIQNLETSLYHHRPRALMQMATGSGKTYTMVSEIYRLIRYAGAKRVLFLVDRGNLGKQAETEFAIYDTPDDGRKFTELYNVQRMTTNTIDPVSKVCISTIQRLFSMLKGEEAYDGEKDERSSAEVLSTEREQVVEYNPRIPIEMFDFIVVDECHRSIYKLWRQVLEYFDAFIIGLTATPSKLTMGYFNRNLVMEYNHERAVADGVNVGYEVYRIKTRTTAEGGTVQAGWEIEHRDRQTRERRWEQLDEDLDYEPVELDRSVVVPDQIRKIIRAWKDALFTELFPGRTTVPKTLIFAKDDSHAEDILHIVREEFGKGNDFCKKITYKTTGEKPEDLIKQFRNTYDPRIAVTVDMIATGTDVKAIECLIFMRDIRSANLFEQMKGRGTRVIKRDDLVVITPDAPGKDHFVIVDAVGVCESCKTDTQPMEKKRTVTFETLIQQVALGNHDPEMLSSLAGRIARVAVKASPEDIRKVEDLAGISLSDMANSLLNAIDPDVIQQRASEIAGGEPSEEQVKTAREELAQQACDIFDSPTLRDLLCEVKRKSEQLIDIVTQDEVLFAGFDEQAKEKARGRVDSFRKFIEDNKDELLALQILYSKQYRDKQLTYDAIRQLAERLEMPPYRLTTDMLWQAYGQLEASRVHGAGPRKMLTNIISLIRFALGQADELMPFPEDVDMRFNRWLERQQRGGKVFTEEQLQWLQEIKRHIASSVRMENADFELSPFAEKGGLYRAYAVFGDELNSIMDELNIELVA